METFLTEGQKSDQIVKDGGNEHVLERRESLGKLEINLRIGKAHFGEGQLICTT